MPSFDIIKQIDVENSFRVEKVKSDFDVKTEHATEHFKGEIVTPDKWNIGVIVGGSGTGKSTIAKELYPENFITSFCYTHKSVIDDMPNTNMNEIEHARDLKILAESYTVERVAPYDMFPQTSNVEVMCVMRLRSR